MTKLKLTFSCSAEEALEKIKTIGLWKDESLLEIETLTNRKLNQNTKRRKSQ